jgi:hypothetical protein
MRAAKYTNAGDIELVAEVGLSVRVDGGTSSFSFVYWYCVSLGFGILVHFFSVAHLFVYIG